MRVFLVHLLFLRNCQATVFMYILSISMYIFIYRPFTSVRQTETVL